MITDGSYNVQIEPFRAVNRHSIIQFRYVITRVLPVPSLMVMGYAKSQPEASLIVEKYLHSFAEREKIRSPL